ncbi:MAG: rod shape-determining protein MreD [Candidatus Marinimicrobia bacterium]|jgi:rod shape-determining protein MreD|nr:rod shape-determining protein MreD [Candidatus Neomarinimicrobiota bacterium]MBT3937119.1 rod shape-determining protein MreD [Candidatus Neomarinimicrobiota bacterium]MBT3962089.1 rod shape-determining protein MreD [Candidatus Neomarinimicrobiota bacterium]MBT4382457.1 rod shape-determining protein MreD [Candidatus Neomarinimicrobiota bacterium]MBT4636574.1 rod shape-determining protein MreD [Candidatus Neomarinimicrobiota bacterium]
MILIKFILPSLAIFFFQFLFSEILSISTIRPDFPIIYVMYIALRQGRFQGVIIGFILGIFIDLAGVSSYFGLTPLTYSITAYITGILHIKSDNLNHYYYTASWIAILFFHFLIFSLVRYQTILMSDILLFSIKWFSTTAYTLGFMLILQLIYNVNPNKV